MQACMYTRHTRPTINSDGWVVGGDNGGSGITQSVLSGSYAEDQK